jgi:5-methylcytosine-specific restriction enzyme subunit McrC
MNRFFQKLISRFLHEHLSDVEVRDEFRLKEMFSYDPAHNPHARRNPIVRPDFVLVRAGETVSVLDAKYRDLWDQPLPRDMLYQLSLYAMGRTGGDRSSVILYPALETSAREQRIRIREPSVGTPQASVILRPVYLGRLCELVEHGTTMRAKASDYAEQLALR